MRRSPRALLLVVLLVAGYWTYERTRDAPPGSGPPVPTRTEDGRAATGGGSDRAGADRIAELFSARESGVVVEASGTVDRILPDDHEGSRHQRFIVRLPDGATVLLSHNIDLAPRVEGLAIGSAVSFRGQYEWNERGGVVHWTHQDRGGADPAAGSSTRDDATAERLAGRRTVGSLGRQRRGEGHAAVDPGGEMLVFGDSGLVHVDEARQRAAR